MTQQRSLLANTCPLLVLLAAVLLYLLRDVVSLFCLSHPEVFGISWLNFQALKLHTLGLDTWICSEYAVVPSSTGQEPGWNLLHHLGGNGPWVQHASSYGSQSAIEPPEGCKVEQVHMLSRHNERYPTRMVGERHRALIKRLQDLHVPLNGSLAFLSNWTYFVHDPSQYGQLISTGPYAGTLGALTAGAKFRTRYAHLLPPDRKTRLWASDSRRDIETARFFATGFFGPDWEQDQRAELEIIPESFDRHTDTLTPGYTCKNYIQDSVQGHDYGKNMQVAFQEVYIPPIAHRLIHEQGNHAVGNFSNLEVYSMQEMCGFETMARGSSPWCNVFTPADWAHFEYARDVLHYYRGGPGNPYAGAMGWLWLNATANLLETGPEVGTLFLSFVHDNDVTSMLTALDLFRDPKYDPNLPVTHIARDRVWQMSTVLPMGGRITFERLYCSARGGSFVRINVNDGIIPLPDCHSGPGGSCSVERFVDLIRKRRGEVDDFVQVCGTSGDRSEGLTFLRQPGP